MQPDSDLEKLFVDFARSIIQTEMKKRNFGYRELTERYNERFRSLENERNLRNKVARGTFSTSFFLMCLYAMDCPSVDITAERLRLLRGPNTERD
jgi:hypothetical protein